MLKLDKLPNEILDIIISHLPHKETIKTPTLINKEFYKAHLYRVKLHKIAIKKLYKFRLFNCAKYALRAKICAIDMFNKPNYILANITKLHLSKIKTQDKLSILYIPSNIIELKLTSSEIPHLVIDERSRLKKLILKSTNVYNDVRLPCSYNNENNVVYNDKSNKSIDNMCKYGSNDKCLFNDNVYLQNNVYMQNNNLLDKYLIKPNSRNKYLTKTNLENKILSNQLPTDIYLTNNIEHIEIYSSYINFINPNFDNLKHIKLMYLISEFIFDWMFCAMDVAQDYVKTHIPIKTISNAKNVSVIHDDRLKLNTNIESLALTDIYIPNAIEELSLFEMENYKNLKHLQLNYNDTDDFAIYIPFENLESLTLHFGVEDIHAKKQIINIQSKKLKKLNVYNCYIWSLCTDNIESVKGVNSKFINAKFPVDCDVKLSNCVVDSKN